MIVLRACGALVLLFSLSGCATRAGAPPTIDPAAVGEVDSIAAATLAERQIPGLSLVMLRGPETLLARGYGVRELGKPDAVSPTTVFQQGSTSKEFLAALVLRLAEQGRLTVDDPVTRHLPDFNHLPPGVRVRHLLSHTSGIREPFTMPTYQAGIGDLGRSTDELRALLRSAPVDFDAGSRWSYSNANYLLLALIVERLTGQPYEEALAEHFFRPLGLASLRQCTPLPSEPDEARGHVLRRDQIRPSKPENMRWIRGDGGLCGNALDVARWVYRLASGKILSPSSYRLMSAPTRLDDGSLVDYGFGLVLVPLDGRPTVAHSGAMPGHSTSASYYPDADLTVVILTNLGDVAADAIDRGLARRLLELPAPDWSARPIDVQQRQRFIGSYDIGVFVVSIVERDGELWFEAPRPGPRAALRHLGLGAFVDKTDPDAVRVDFATATDPASALRLFMGGMHWYGRRLP